MSHDGTPEYPDAAKAFDEAWHRAQSSSNLQIVFLEAPSGMKKTKFVSNYLRDRDLPTVTTHGTKVPTSYFPIAQAFESIMELDPVQRALEQDPGSLDEKWNATLTALATAAPETRFAMGAHWHLLSTWVTTERALISDDEPVAMEAQFSYVVNDLPRRFSAALGELGNVLPYVLFFDDLDHADSATLDAFARIILPAVGNYPILIIFALDISQSDAPTVIRNFIKISEEVTTCVHLQLNPATRRDIELLVLDRFGDVSDPRFGPLCAQIHEITNGNYAQIGDAISLISRLGLSSVLESPSRLFGYGEVTKTTLTEFLDLRDQQLLHLASCQGQYFCIQALASAARIPESEVVGRVRIIELTFPNWIERDVNEQIGDRTVSWSKFGNRRFRQLIYDSLTNEERVDFHRRTANAFEEVYRGYTDSISERLAYQFGQAQLSEKAATHLANASHQANDFGTPLIAIKFAQQGLEYVAALDGSRSDLSCKLLLEQGRAQRLTDQSNRAIETLRDAYELAKQVGASEVEVTAGFYLGASLLDANQWDEGIQVTREVLRPAIALNMWTFLADTLEILRERYYKRGDATFVALCNDMVDIMRSQGSEAAELTSVDILEDKAWFHYSRRENTEAMEALSEAASILSHIENAEQYPIIQYKLHRWRSRLLGILGDYNEALSEADEAIIWASATHRRAYLAFAKDTRARCLADLKRIDDANHEYEGAIQLLRNSYDRLTLGEIHENYGLYLSHRGLRRQAQEQYRSAERSYRLANNLERRQTALNDLATIQKYRGEFQPALAVYEQLLNEGIAQNNRSRQGLALNHMGDIYRIQGKPYDAERAHTRALQLHHSIRNLSSVVVTQRYLGQTFLTALRLDKAREALVQASEMYSEGVSINVWQGMHVEILRARLKMLVGEIDAALHILDVTLIQLEEYELIPLAGICRLNLALVFLSMGLDSEALIHCCVASEAFAVSESCMRQGASSLGPLLSGIR